MFLLQTVANKVIVTEVIIDFLYNSLIETVSSGYFYSFWSSNLDTSNHKDN